MVGLRGVPASYGGVERAVEELSAELADRGHDVTVFARTAYSDPSISEHRGARVVHLPQINTKHLEAISHTALAVLRIALKRDFDVVHFHATGPSLLAFVPRLVGIPTVTTVQGLDYRREKWGWGARQVLRLASWAAARFPSETIVVSRTLQQHYATELRARTTYVPNGVELEATSGAGTPKSGLVAGQYVLFLGRLVPEKHVHTLIAAYRHVDSSFPLVIAGPHSHSPEYLERLETLAAQDDRVRLVGPCYGSEKKWLMSHSAAFVQPSSIEGLPIALLEAIAAGAVPVVSDIPENLEPVSIGDQRLAETAPPGDALALARAITATLALTAEERAARVRELRAHAGREYDWGNIAESTERIYRSLA